MLQEMLGDTNEGGLQRSIVDWYDSCNLKIDFLVLSYVICPYYDMLLSIYCKAESRIDLEL